MKKTKIITLNTVLAVFCCFMPHIGKTVIDKEWQIWYNLRDCIDRVSTNRTLQMNLFWRMDIVPQESVNDGLCVADNANLAQKIFDEHGEFRHCPNRSWRFE